MRKIALLFGFALTLSCVLTGCHHGIQGSGVRKTEKRELASFKAIDTTGAYEVKVTCQKPVAVEIEADDNILPLIQTEVRDGVLYVTSEKSYNSRKGVTLRISVPNLERLKSTGADEFQVADLKNEKFSVNSTGASTVMASGETKTVDIESSGADKIDTSELKAQKVSVSSSGAASIDVFASEQLDVTVSGAASVRYGGDPKVTKNISGVGSVSKKG